MASVSSLASRGVLAVTVLGLCCLVYLHGFRSSWSFDDSTSITPKSSNHNKKKHATLLNKKLLQSQCPGSVPQPVTEQFSRAHAVAVFLEGPGLAQWHDKSIKEATCKFRLDHNDHQAASRVPHAMQQLYRCVSWWHANPRKKAVLLSPPPNPESQFLKGFLDTLQTIFRVKFATQRERRQAVRPKVDYGLNASHYNGGFKMRSPGDLDMVKQRTLKKLEIDAGGCPAGKKDSFDEAVTPKIVLWNRPAESGRHVLTEQVWKQVIETELPGVHVQLQQVDEQQDFADQLRLLQQTDILISPHGDHLIALPFLPHCAHVVELFPAEYSVPRFYGTLAASAGIRYSSLQPSSDDDSVLDFDNATAVAAALSRDVCVSPNDILTTVIPFLRQSIANWQKCCGIRQ